MVWDAHIGDTEAAPALLHKEMIFFPGAVCEAVTLGLQFSGQFKESIKTEQKNATLSEIRS